MDNQQRVFRRLPQCLPAVLALFSALSFQANTAPTPTAAESKKNQIDSFELVWTTLRDSYWDKTMAGLDWQAIHDRYLVEVKAATTPEQARAAMSHMIALLPSSHLAIIPGSLYKRHRARPETKASEKSNKAETPPKADDSDDFDDAGSTGMTVGAVEGQLVVTAVEPGSGAEKAGVHTGWAIRSINDEPLGDLDNWTGAGHKPKDIFISQLVAYWLAGPAGSPVKVTFEKAHNEMAECEIMREEPVGELSTFGNFPPMRVVIEHRKLKEGVGYIRLNLFLNPVKVMPEIEKAIDEFKDLPGIVFDLRGNPGGIAGMGMGIAGWFVSERDRRLGTMTSRTMTLNFSINPRLNNYHGRLAILVNGGSASTSEIFAQGLQDLGRARIFGTPTAAAALPSAVLPLPDGDRFQYPQANYVSVKGRVLEGNGVQPDEVVGLTIARLLAGHDEQLEKASEWSRGK